MKRLKVKLKQFIARLLLRWLLLLLHTRQVKRPINNQKRLHKLNWIKRREHTKHTKFNNKHLNLNFSESHELLLPINYYCRTLMGHCAIPQTFLVINHFFYFHYIINANFEFFFFGIFFKTRIFGSLTG